LAVTDAPDLESRRPTLASALAPFAVPDTRIGLRLFAIDLAVYMLGLALALFAETTSWRVFGAVLVGLKMGSLYTLAHDGAHKSLTASRRLNRWLASLGYLLSLHNYRIRVHDHLVLGHHPKLNGPQPDVYRPLSLAEYRAAPLWRRAWERFTRSPNPFAFAPYGIFSRWLQAEVVPKRSMSRAHQVEAWGCVGLLLAYLALIVGWLAHRNAGDAAAFLADVGLVLGLPFFIFQTLQAAILYFQHTHPAVPWFAAGDPRWDEHGVEELTVHVRVPAWLATLTHDICEHPAHHVLPSIPCYRLRAAQARLAELLGERALELPLSPHAMAEIMRRCKLYDYEDHRWLDFDGQPTGERTTVHGALISPSAAH
jgi:acyl-lipid omega-6 desaturase (Delta-12 desaturase)